MGSGVFERGTMRLRARNRAPRWRTVAVLAVGIAIGTSMMATPASGHITGSVTHVVKHMKQYFFTKATSDARYERRAGAWRELGVADFGQFICTNADGDGSPVYWRNTDPSFYTTAAYVKDGSGFVHLKGNVARICPSEWTRVPSSNQVIFQLPPGYQPSHFVLFPGNGIATVTVDPGGRVQVVEAGPAGLSLNGLIFRVP
jgi:hypothetical protein